MFIKHKKSICSECSGRTMLEMIAVIGLISVMAVSAYGVINNTYAKFRIFKTRTQYRDIIENIRKFYANDYNYVGLSRATAISNNLIPKDAVGGANIVLATGAEVIDISADADVNVRAFNLSIKSKYASECASLMDMFIDQVNPNKASYKVIHDTKNLFGDIITYSWEGDKNDCSVNHVHFSCVNVSKNITKCADSSEIKAYYY